MEEERVKSAFEIAMERISKLPELTPDEIAAQREKENAPIGLALSKKFLDGMILECEIAPELNKYQGEQGRIIRRFLLDALCRSMQLDDRQKSLKALSGIRQLIPDKSSVAERAEQDLQRVLAEYEQEKAGESQKLENLALESLEDLGLSGSAIRPNPAENKAWQQGMQRIRLAYEPRLESIRKTLAAS